MSWFTRLCRKSGLLINRAMQGKPRQGSQTLHCRQFTQQKQVSANVTLRRTTIEEVQIHDQGATQDRAPVKLEQDQSPRQEGMKQ